jgi:hypothetical protein
MIPQVPRNDGTAIREEWTWGNKGAQRAHERNMLLVIRERELEPLDHDDRVRAQPLAQMLIELTGVETERGTFREQIDHVDDDDIVEFVRFLDEFPTVAIDDTCARILERTPAPTGQELAANLDRLLVYVDHRDCAHLVVGQHLPQRGALAAADDESSAGIGMDEHRRLDEHLVIERLVAERALYLAVHE